MLGGVEGTLCSSEGGNVAWFCADIINNRRLKPRNIEMCSFLINIPTHATDPLILDSPVSSVNYPLDLGPSNQGVPLKMEALMAKTANPPTMTRPPSPSDPRGSFGGPPPAPRCLIISRKLGVRKTSAKRVLVHWIASRHWGMATQEIGSTLSSKNRRSTFSLPTSFEEDQPTSGTWET